MPEIIVKITWNNPDYYVNRVNIEDALEKYFYDKSEPDTLDCKVVELQELKNK